MGEASQNITEAFGPLRDLWFPGRGCFVDLSDKVKEDLTNRFCIEKEKINEIFKIALTYIRDSNLCLC